MSTGRGTADVGGPQHPKWDIAELASRIENLIRVGRIYEVDYDAKKARVIFGPEGGEHTFITDWLSWASMRAGNNRTWSPPEKGEQFAVFSPSGHLENGFVALSIASGDFPCLANSPDYAVEDYREGMDKEQDGYYEYNRKTGVQRWRLKASGSYRWEIGDNASIIMDQTYVQLRVGETQLVVTEDGIRLHVKGTATELKLTEQSIIAHVANKGVLQILKDKVVAAVNGSSLLRITASAVRAAIKGALLDLAENKATLSGGSSSLELAQRATLTSPSFAGVSGSATVASDKEDALAPETPHETVAAPAPPPTGKPYRPSAA